jgi:hypothetical protein
MYHRDHLYNLQRTQTPFLIMPLSPIISTFPTRRLTDPKSYRAPVPVRHASGYALALPAYAYFVHLLPSPPLLLRCR